MVGIMCATLDKQNNYQSTLLLKHDRLTAVAMCPRKSNELQNGYCALDTVTSWKITCINFWIRKPASVEKWSTQHCSPENRILPIRFQPSSYLPRHMFTLNIISHSVVLWEYQRNKEITTHSTVPCMWGNNQLVYTYDQLLHNISCRIWNCIFPMGCSRLGM